MNEEAHTLLCNKCINPSMAAGLESADYCKICCDGGELICCDGGCFLAFHFACIGLDECPEGDTWLCSECTRSADSMAAAGNKSKKSTKKRRKKRH